MSSIWPSNGACRALLVAAALQAGCHQCEPERLGRNTTTNPADIPALERELGVQFGDAARVLGVHREVGKVVLGRHRCSGAHTVLLFDRQHGRTSMRRKDGVRQQCELIMNGDYNGGWQTRSTFLEAMFQHRARAYAESGR